MHSFGYRANALLTYALTILALMCTIASFSDNFNFPSPSVEIQVLNFNWFQKQPHGNDEVSLTMNITADLQSLFTWNTKQLFIFVAAEYETPQNSLNQVSLWDAIIPAKEHAKFWFQTANKYRFIDQGSNLRGKEFNLTLHWHVMPKTGKMLADKVNRKRLKTPGEITDPTNRAVIRVYTVWQASLQPYLPLLLPDESPTKYGMIKVSLIKKTIGRENVQWMRK